MYAAVMSCLHMFYSSLTLSDREESKRYVYDLGESPSVDIYLIEYRRYIFSFRFYVGVALLANCSSYSFRSLGAVLSVTIEFLGNIWIKS